MRDNIGALAEMTSPEIQVLVIVLNIFSDNRYQYFYCSFCNDVLSLQKRKLMKKLILTLLSILLFIYIILSLLSLRGDYRAERELWKVNRTLFYVASHEESTPDYAINQLAHRYRSFAKKYNKSIYANRAQIMLGDLYALRKDYAQARLEYQKSCRPR